MSQTLLAYQPETDISALSPPTRAIPEHILSARARLQELDLAAELADTTDAAATARAVGRIVERIAKRQLSPKLKAVLTSGLQRVAKIALTNSMVRKARSRTSPNNHADLFGAELEGLSPEDREFETARNFSRLATEVVRLAVLAPNSANPEAVMHAALSRAARRLAPGLAMFSDGWRGSKPSGCRCKFLCNCRQPSKTMEPRMHDIDRTQQEFSGEGPFGESEFETGLLSEEEEVALTGELLNVANEDELEEFLGGLVRRVGRAAGGLMRSPLGSALGGVLRDAARRALPLAGGALGGVIGGPIGAQLGSRLAGFAADRLETEDETFGEEEAEFEGARRFVQFAANTVHRAAANGDTGNPRTIAQQAAMSAARAHLPELLKRSATAQGKAPHLGQSGRWVRRGNKIILLDL